MIDAHVHLEKSDYSVEWIEQFIEYAVKRNIDKIFFSEHTFVNFLKVFQSIYQLSYILCYNVLYDFVSLVFSYQDS